MSHKRKGQLADSNEWRKHLRPLYRRFYWKRGRVAEKYEIKSQLSALHQSNHLRREFGAPDSNSAAQVQA